MTYKVLTDTRELTHYCRESVKAFEGERFVNLLKRIKDKKAKELIINIIVSKKSKNLEIDHYLNTHKYDNSIDNSNSSYKIIELINKYFKTL